MTFSPFRLLCLTGFLAIFGTTMAKNPVLPFFAEFLGADAKAIGLVASLSPLAGVLVSLPAGMLSDRIGRGRLLRLSGLFFALSPLGYLWAGSVWELALVRFIHGLATGIFMPVAMAMVADMHATSRGERLGLMSSVTQLGRFLAPLAGGILLGLGGSLPGKEGFTWVYAGCLVLGAGAAFLVFRLPTETPKMKAAGTGPPAALLWSVLRNRPILLGCLVEAAALFAFGTFEAFFPRHVRDAGLGPYWIGALMAVQVLTVALSKPLFGRLSDRKGREWQIVFGAVAMAATMFAMGQARGLVSLGAISLALGLSLSFTLAASSAFIADASPAETRGTAMGLLGSIMDIGHSAGPLAAGMVIAVYGNVGGFLCSGLVVLAAGVVFAIHGAGAAESDRRP
jgi:MFS transporter, DHA1 family, multidrug resistance protein